MQQHGRRKKEFVSGRSPACWRWPPGTHTSEKEYACDVSFCQDGTSEKAYASDVSFCEDGKHYDENIARESSSDEHHAHVLEL